MDLHNITVYPTNMYMSDMLVKLLYFLPLTTRWHQHSHILLHSNLQTRYFSLA